VIAIEPELEAPLMNDSSVHLAKIFKCPENYRHVLANAGYWPRGAGTPPRPKEALGYVRRHQKVKVFNVEFGKPTEAMPVRECQDRPFLLLGDQQRAWFLGHS